MHSRILAPPGGCGVACVGAGRGRGFLVHTCKELDRGSFMSHFE